MARPLNVARRFSLAYVALAALLGTGAGLFVVVVERPPPAPPPPWSTWLPSRHARAAQQQQIATHIQAEYRFATGKSLVNVVVRDPQNAPVIQDIALTRTLFPSSRSDVISAVNSNRTAMYVLCGDAPHCAIKVGKPSDTRTEVLRREALELALYTFRYVGDTDSVLVSFPPKDLNYVMYFTKGDLAGELHQPLRRTLAQMNGTVPRSLSQNERGVIDELTIPREFRGALRDEGNGANVLYLAPR